MTGAPLHDPWLNPADEHFGGCDGKCHAGLCEERDRVLTEAADEDGDDVVDRLRLAAKPEEIAAVWGLTVVRCSLLREAADEIELFRGFFWEFGTHQDECGVNYSNTCDCGWDDAVATLPDEVT